MKTPCAIALPGGATSYPVVCAPLVGRTREALLAEVRTVAGKRPDLIEWRVDFFEGLADATQVVPLARALHEAAAGIPLLFTRRSTFEGGERPGLPEPQAAALAAAVCASGAVAAVDWEMDRGEEALATVKRAARANGVQLLLSFHDFQATPARPSLVARLRRMQALGADIAKVAVMPRSLDDVLTLLAATHEASEALDIPVATMAMGPLGTVTRTSGFVFGSAITFAVGASASAPGQMAIEDVRAAIAALQRSNA